MLWISRFELDPLAQTTVGQFARANCRKENRKSQEFSAGRLSLPATWLVLVNPTGLSKWNKSREFDRHNFQ